MRRHTNAALMSIVVLAAAMPAVSAEKIPSPENESPSTASCSPFLRTARAGRVADRAAARFERQQSEWNSMGALDYLRDQLVSSLRPELPSPADTAAIRTLPRATVDACFPRLAMVLASLTQGSDYERLNAELAESRKRNADEQQASNDAARRVYDEHYQANRKEREAEMKERAEVAAQEPSVADMMRIMRANQAEQQRALEAAIADAAKPTTMMLNAYRNYLAARQCFDSRAGFAVVYVTAQQMEEAKAQVKGIEAALLQKEPSLATDERWETANREEAAANDDITELVYTGRGYVKERTYTEQGRRFCAIAVGWLRERYGDLYPDSRTMKKDF